MERDFDRKDFFPTGEDLVDAVKETSEILRTIIRSKEEGKSIAISSPLLGEHFVITAIDEIIIEDGDTIIRLKPFDSSGYVLPQSKLRLADILAVCSFRSDFNNPVLKNFDRPRNWYF